MKNKVLQAIKD